MHLSAEDIRARILHQDRHVIILNKPAGIAVHAGSGKNDSLDQSFEHLTFGESRPPALAHRLDRETSGCLVLGRSRESLARLGRYFQKGLIKKTYLAIVAHAPSQNTGIVAVPLARRSHDKRSWVMKVATEGDPQAEMAETHFRVLKRGDGLSLLSLSPQTGRTHQLRVHCAHLGCPIAGDKLYGGDKATALAARLQLHARAIALPPTAHNEPPLSVSAPLPDHMLPLLRLLGLDAAAITHLEQQA